MQKPGVQTPGEGVRLSMSEVRRTGMNQHEA